MPPKSSATIAARVYFDHERKQWRAATLQDPQLQVSGLTARQARRRLVKLVGVEMGAKALCEELELPPELAAPIRAYQAVHEKWEALGERLRADRLPLAHLLFQYRLAQSDVAGLLRISAAQLGVHLSREATEPGREKPAQRRGRPKRSTASETT
jgi:hypothetical protein